MLNGFYINLEHRKDRNSHIKDLIKKIIFFRNIKRMEAIKKNNGHLGCAMSHCKCLIELLNKKDDCYLIIEDDFMILNEENFKTFVNEFNKIKNNKNWDLLTLTPRGKIVENNYINNFNKIKDTQTTSGYIIKHSFIKKLLNIFRLSIKNLKENKNSNNWAIDQSWKLLQKKYNFIYFNKNFGGQKPSFSDIENKYCDYNYHFNI